MFYILSTITNWYIFICYIYVCRWIFLFFYFTEHNCEVVTVSEFLVHSVWEHVEVDRLGVCWCKRHDNWCLWLSLCAMPYEHLTGIWKSKKTRRRKNNNKNAWWCHAPFKLKERASTIDAVHHCACFNCLFGWRSPWCYDLLWLIGWVGGCFFSNACGSYLY